MKTFEEVLAGMDEGQRNAIIRKVARAQTGDETVVEQVLQAVLSGDLRIVLVDGVTKFYDHTSRGIKLPTMKETVLDPDRSFNLTHPTSGLTTPFNRLKQFYGNGCDFPSLSEVESRYNAAIERVKANNQIVNLLKGPHYLFVIPKMEGDLGTILDGTIVPALERSYKEQFPKRSFTNYRHGQLAGQVTVIPNTRQDRLIEAMAKGWVVGAYFPCLQGFSILADREFIAAMPECLILSGMEVLVVATAYPHLIARDWHTPGLDMASLQWRDPGCSLCFEASVDEADFGSRCLRARGNCSGGVSVLG